VLQESNNKSKLLNVTKIGQDIVYPLAHLIDHLALLNSKKFIIFSFYSRFSW